MAEHFVGNKAGNRACLTPDVSARIAPRFITGRARRFNLRYWQELQSYYEARGCDHAASLAARQVTRIVDTRVAFCLHRNTAG